MIPASHLRRTIPLPWLTNCLLCAVGAALLLLTRDLVGEFTHYRIGFSAVSGWSLAAYSLAVLAVLTLPVNRYTFGIVLGFAIAFRLVTLIPEPRLSTDIYRYAWDGAVQNAGISPYRYVPGDPALTFLRQPNRELFDHMNRRDYARTIYPPGAQMLFLLIAFLNPTMTFMKLAMILIEGITLFALVRLLCAMGLRREQALIYAWCPLLVWEIGSSGHLDSAAMASIALALWMRYRQKPMAAGAFLAMAILIKFYPVVLLPALYRRGEWKMPATVAAAVAFAYACYASVGWGVFGFLGGYTQEEGMQTGERYFLLGLAHRIPGFGWLTTGVFLGFSLLCFSALCLWCWKTCCDPGKDRLPLGQTLRFGLPPQANFLAPAFALGTTLMLLFSPHYPWYVAWLVPFLALVPNLTVFAYVGGLFYLLTTSLAVGYGPKQFLLNQILYGVLSLAFAIELLLRRWPMLRRAFSAAYPPEPTAEAKA